eukprot:GCRY01000432.1.p1 GENE.GCRY01000432.1~~GCRY01000432.1.p1  ORF type:complete len:313 (+),score=131.30 GCRY01000432.1:219-1157(+)
MFGKKKAALQAKVAEKKDEHEKKNQDKWTGEVVKDDGSFGRFEDWKAVYEAKKEKEGNKEDSKLKEAAEKKALEKISQKIKKKIMIQETELISALFGATEDVFKGVDPEIARFVNTANAAVLTYRFAGKGKKRMAFLRSLAAEKMALALGEVFAKEGKALGVEPSAIDPKVAEKIVATVTKKITDAVVSSEAKARAALENSPVFAHAPAGAEEKMDEGVEALKDFLRTFVEGKLGTMINVVDKTVSTLLLAMTVHAKALVLAQTDSDEFASGKDDMLKEIEKSYGIVDAAVDKYVASLVDLIMKGDDDEDEE